MKKLLYALPILILLLWPIAPVYAFTGNLDGRVVFGQSFTLQSGQTLDGDLVVFGGEATIEENATVKGNVVIIGGSLTMNGSATGDAVVIGGLMTMGDKFIRGRKCDHGRRFVTTRRRCAGWRSNRNERSIAQCSNSHHAECARASA